MKRSAIKFGCIVTIVRGGRGWSDIMAADNGGDKAIYTPE